MRWAADKPRCAAWDGHGMGHHLKRQYIDHTEERVRREKEGGEEKMYCIQAVNSQPQILTATRRRPIAASIFSPAGGWAGSFEKDVYFSTVPSQKSTLSSLATITEQLLWLGGAAPACLTLAAFCQPKKNLLNSHPACKNRRKADTKANVTQCVCIRGKLHKLWSFYQRQWWRGLGF